MGRPRKVGARRRRVRGPWGPPVPWETGRNTSAPRRPHVAPVLVQYHRYDLAGRVALEGQGGDHDIVLEPILAGAEHGELRLPSERRREPRGRRAHRKLGARGAGGEGVPTHRDPHALRAAPDGGAPRARGDPRAEPRGRRAHRKLGARGEVAEVVLSRVLRERGGTGELDVRGGAGGAGSRRLA